MSAWNGAKNIGGIPPLNRNTNTLGKKCNSLLVNGGGNETWC